MYPSDQDEDERAVQDRLIALVDGPPPTTGIPPKPAERPRDWLDQIIDDNGSPAPEAEESVEEEPEAEPAPPQTSKPKKPKVRTRKRKLRAKSRQGRKRHAPGAARSAWDGHPQDPRQSLIDAWGRIPYRLKWLGYHLAAAYAGWRLGIVTWSSNTAAWFAAGHWTNSSAWVLYALGALVAALYRRSRPWAWPAAWLAAIPVSSVVIGLLLYGTDYMNLRIPL